MTKSVLFLAGVILLFWSCKKASEEKKEKKPDEIVERKSTRTENVRILDREFFVKNDNDVEVSRSIWLYLPPDYKTSVEKYPVIYMHDGQNLFDNKTSYAGEWEVDETLNAIFEKTKKGFIVVGINNTAERMSELTPWANKKHGGGNGNKYLKMIIEELKPFIDSTYRTKSDRENTAIMGSSLGGLISYYAGLHDPETFGKIGALSTSFWFSDKVNDFSKEKGNLKDTQIYFLVGEKEGEEMIEGTKTTLRILSEENFPSENIKTKFVADGEHNETFWKNEFLDAITFLFKL